MAKKDILELISETVSFEIQAAFMEVIDAFYASYTPTVYQRTEATYMASSNYNESTRFMWEGQHTVAGIQVDAGFIEGNYGGQPYYNHWGKNKGKPMNTEWVFERTFSKGIHGMNKADYLRFKNSDYSKAVQAKAEKSYASIKKFAKKMKKEVPKYKRPKYFLEKYFRSYYIGDKWATTKSPMSPLTPPPKARMNKKYKDFTNGGKMRDGGMTLPQISEYVISSYLTQHPEMIFRGGRNGS